jgi:hypothetical protein
MTIAYQVSSEYGEYTHGEIIAQCSTLEEANKWYLETVKDCISDGVDNFTDYVCIEEIDAEIDDNGEVIDSHEVFDVIVEHIFNEQPE